MRVAVPAIPSGAAFSYRPPEAMLSIEAYRLGNLGRGFDITPDGKRFLMVKAIGADVNERQSITVVSHWFDELRARVTGK